MVEVEFGADGGPVDLLGCGWLVQRDGIAARVVCSGGELRIAPMW